MQVEDRKLDDYENDQFEVEEQNMFSEYRINRDNSSKITIYDLITLKNFKLEIGKGEFVAIVGQIRSGKSSVLSSIIGDMLYINQETIHEFKNNQIFKPTDNEDSDTKAYMLSLNQKNYENFTELRKNQDPAAVVHISGSISYVQQTPWILNQTVKDNILFGEKEDKARYNKTVKSCQLLKDFRVFEGGDLTQIGEKGSSLSGGQKARISMARAVYSNKDIILMDD